MDTLGLRFIVCGSVDEIKACIDYIKDHNITYRSIPQPMGDIRIDGKDDDMTIIWYIGDLKTQYDLVSLTNGRTLF